ncbi:MAG: hypothetical protein ACRECP_11820 [Methylocella sp.]
MLPFEFAVFDLEWETSAKQDFAPIEAALTAAGFAMSEIKFRPNSTGKIIVGDTKQAALLEFCGAINRLTASSIVNWKIEQITTIPSMTNRRFDLHPQYGLACLVSDTESQTLYLNGRQCRTWSITKFRSIWGVRWFSQDQVLLWWVDMNAVRASEKTWMPIGMGRLWDIICGKDYLFVTYDDESVTRAHQGELEHNVLAVFSRDGVFRVGLTDLLEKRREKKAIIMEINAAYAFGNTIVFIPYTDESLCVLNVEQETLTKHDVSFNTANTVAISGNDKQAFAVIGYEEPYELVLIDMASGQSRDGDFRVLADKLDAAGFKPGAWNFRSGLGGKMIVSDDKQAGFIELL